MMNCKRERERQRQSAGGVTRINAAAANALMCTALPPLPPRCHALAAGTTSAAAVCSKPQLSRTLGLKKV